MPPSGFQDLNDAEQLLLLAFRRSLSGQARAGLPETAVVDPRPCVDMAWRLACGETRGGHAAVLFAQLTRCLSRCTRRPRSLAPPHVDAITLDERSLLELVAACQREAAPMAVALARWLVRAPDHVALLVAAAALARVMSESGLELRAPSAFRADRMLHLGEEIVAPA